MSRRRGLWGTRFGFYLAAIGSAFGLGNLWRFPSVTVQNGGGAFVLLYVFAAMIVGLPLLVGELMLGKIARRSIVKASDRLAFDELISAKPDPSRRRVSTAFIRASGRLSAIACLLVFAYYAVISGWVLHFLMQFSLRELGSSGFDAENALAALRASGPLQIALTSAHLLLAIVVVSRGVQEGIEKWVGNLMPIFGALLLILAAKSLSLPTAPDALRFLFYPDFSRLSWSALIHAIGHVCFTLSLGFGTMVTFGSYLNDNAFIPSAGFRVAVVDTLISLFAGLLIFPIAAGSPGGISGPDALFLTVPAPAFELSGRRLFRDRVFSLPLFGGAGREHRPARIDRLQRDGSVRRAARTRGLGDRRDRACARRVSRAVDFRARRRFARRTRPLRSVRRRLDQRDFAARGVRFGFRHIDAPEAVAPTI